MRDAPDNSDLTYLTFALFPSKMKVLISILVCASIA